MGQAACVCYNREKDEKVVDSKAARQELSTAAERVSQETGTLAVAARYHRSRRVQEDYELTQRVLGVGFSGDVKFGKSKATGTLHAIKRLSLHIADKEAILRLRAELEIFLRLDHPHVAILNDVYETDDELVFVMEFLKGGELYDRLVSQGKYSELDAATAAYQMLRAISYLHTHGVVHRDLKLENFLYESETGNHLKVIDFGFSKLYKPEDKMHASCGTVSYIAPEVINGSYDNKCDIWSLGVLAFMMLSGEPPFPGDGQETLKLIRRGRYSMDSKRWDKVSEPAKDFVSHLLTYHAKLRPTALEALEHPWITRREGLFGVDIDESVLKSLKVFSQAAKFRRACLRVLATSLSATDRQKIRDTFLALDKNSSGTITLTEFKKALDDHGMASEEAAEVFAAIDVSSDEEVQYSEFLAAVAHSRVLLHDNLIRDTFRRFDTNQSGRITVTNLKDMLGDHFDDNEIAEMLSEVDENHDGAIDYDEFVTYLQKDPAGRKEDDPKTPKVAKTDSALQMFRSDSRKCMQTMKVVDAVVKWKHKRGSNSDPCH